MNISIQNLETGLCYDEFLCPHEIVEVAEDAIGRGQTSGLIYGNGQRWSWATTSLGGTAEVRLEFERGGKLVEAYSIPWQSWEAFKIVSANQGKSAKEYLTLLLGCGLAEGENLGEMIHWMFASPELSEESKRFEAAVVRGEIPVVRLPGGLSWEDLE